MPSVAAIPVSAFPEDAQAERQEKNEAAGNEKAADTKKNKMSAGFAAHDIGNNRADQQQCLDTVTRLTVERWVNHLVVRS
jgi:hypothetical protein